jgi:hypothetical protein
VGLSELRRDSRALRWLKACSLEHEGVPPDGRIRSEPNYERLYVPHSTYRMQKVGIRDSQAKKWIMMISKLSNRDSDGPEVWRQGLLRL